MMKLYLFRCRSFYYNDIKVATNQYGYNTKFNKLIHQDGFHFILFKLIHKNKGDVKKYYNEVLNNGKYGYVHCFTENI